MEESGGYKAGLQNFLPDILQNFEVVARLESEEMNPLIVRLGFTVDTEKKIK